LKEAEGDMKPKEIVIHNTEVLEKLYYIYFKILKREETSKFLISALNGILKYVHFISFDLILSIINQLQFGCKLMRG
jgi:nucleolar complex protein 3